MCGVSGYTGLGHLALEVRYDLVEALGSGIDKRGGHASGAVVVTEEGPPRLMRKLGRWDAARGRFIRAAGNGHSVMMHARYATHGAKEKVENAHPFAVKRKGDDGKDITVLYGCHNGIIYGTESTARQNGRQFSVDSLEFFELLADKAYETIRALTGYGVVTFIRPEDRKIRVLRLNNNSEFKVYRIAGGGIVWGSTYGIVDDALKYCNLTAETELSVEKPGQVYLLSGNDARESKVDGITIGSGFVDRRTSYGGYGGWDWEDSYGVNRNWDDACWICGEYSWHKSNCKDSGGYIGRVVPSESIQKNRHKYIEACKKADSELSAPITPKTVTMPGSYEECEDGTFRRVLNGHVLPYSFPIYARDKEDGSYRICHSLMQAGSVSGRSVSHVTKPINSPLGNRLLTEGEKASAKEVGNVQEDTWKKACQATTGKAEEVEEAPPSSVVPHNGYWSVPMGISKEEQAEWARLYEKSPELAVKLLEDEDEPTETVESWVSDLVGSIGKEAE